MKTKKIWQSWTFWFNLIEGGFALADSLMGLGILTPVTHGIILAVGNLLLRVFKTDSEIKILD